MEMKFPAGRFIGIDVLVDPFVADPQLVTGFQRAGEPEICSGLHSCSKSAVMVSQSAAVNRSFRFCCRRVWAIRSACCGRYPRWPRLRFNCREIVLGWLP